MEDTHRLAPLQALLLLLVKELLLLGIEARGDSKAAKGCLVAVRTRWVNIASLGGLPLFDVCVGCVGCWGRRGKSARAVGSEAR